MESRQKNLITLPAAIIIAGAIIAMAIVWSNKKPTENTPNLASVNDIVTIAPVDKDDHILGDPNAPIVIVEYSDTSCPYCKMFNEIMVDIMDEYGPSGKVAWVYRHFPLDIPDSNGRMLHPNSGIEAQSLECAGSLGGNDKFWAYEKKIYELHPGTAEGLSVTELNQIAKTIGLDETSFSSCVSSGQFKEKVKKDFDEGIVAGVQGTPSSFMITPNKSIIPMPGVVDKNTLKTTIETLLSEN